MNRTHARAAVRLALGALLAATAALSGLPGASRATDSGKGKSNEATVSSRFAEYGITRIALGGATATDRNPESEKLFRQELESAFGALKYKFQGYSFFIASVRQANAEPALDALRRAAFEGARPDSATLAAVRGNSGVDAVLFANLTTMERVTIDPNTRGQSRTQVGGDFVLLALKDGAIVWRGSFNARGDGPYNDPNLADVPERDPTGNARPNTQNLDPPTYREVMDKLFEKVTRSLPPPPAAAAGAPAAKTPDAAAGAAPAH